MEFPRTHIKARPRSHSAPQADDQKCSRYPRVICVGASAHTHLSRFLDLECCPRFRCWPSDSTHTLFLLLQPNAPAAHPLRSPKHEDAAAAIRMVVMDNHGECHTFEIGSARSVPGVHDVGEARLLPPASVHLTICDHDTTSSPFAARSIGSNSAKSVIEAGRWLADNCATRPSHTTMSHVN